VKELQEENDASPKKFHAAVADNGM